MEHNPRDIVTFVNITKQDFTCHWDKEAYSFAPGESRTVELWKALHFAKHLVDRILNERNLPTNSQAERDELVKDIIKDGTVKTPVAPEEKVEVLEPAPEENETRPTKKGRGKKEKEFEDLDNE